jgi:hypothetical protein
MSTPSQKKIMSIRESIKKNVVNITLPNFVDVTVTHVSTTIGVLFFYFLFSL